MKRIRMTVFWLLLVSLLLSPLHGAARAEDAWTGYFAGENGRYAFELAEDGYCYWYQEGTRYAGKYTEDRDGLDLKLVGRGSVLDTAFRAEKQEDGSLTVSGGLVDGEFFSLSEKPTEQEELDALWAKRIRHLKKSSGKISLTETVLLDDDDLKITAVKYSANGNNEEIRLLLENKSDQQMYVHTAGVRINDTLVDLFFFCDLPARESMKQPLRISTTALEAAGIRKIESVTPVFKIVRGGETVVHRDAVSIPVQDSRNRVPVLIPLRKVLLNTNGLLVEMLGYENQGHDVNLLYRVANGGEEDFRVESNRTAINGKAARPYAIGQDVEGCSDSVYQADIWTGDYGNVGKLNALSVDLQLEYSYGRAFVDFGEIYMEFAPDGQLCAFDCSVAVDEDSDFWQENFAEPKVPELPSSEASEAPEDEAESSRERAPEKTLKAKLLMYRMEEG